MKPGRNKGIRLFIIIIHILIVFVFLLVALVPFLDAGRFWFIAFLGLSYPFLLLAVILCFVISMVLRSNWAILPLLAMVLSFQQIGAVFGFRLPNNFQGLKEEKTLRILSWNVSQWSENKNSMFNKSENSYRNIMLDHVQLQDADVLCFQEFFQCNSSRFYPDNIEPIKKMGYPYYYFSPYHVIYNGNFQTGLMIFSRYPILDTAFFPPPNQSNAEGFSFADIDYNGNKIRIFNVHFESPRINRSAYVEPGKLDPPTNIFIKIKRGNELRASQSNLLSSLINSTPFPVIISGDLNDVPNSYTYFKVKGNRLQDAFIKKGSGLGRTFRFISPTLRIDYILADKKFDVLQFGKPELVYSDHYPLVTDLQIK